MGVAGRWGVHHLFQNEYRTQNSQFGHFHLTNKCTYSILLKLLILQGHPPRTPYQSLSLAATKSVAWVKYSFLATSLYTVQYWNYLNIFGINVPQAVWFFLYRSEFSYFEFNAEVKIGTLKKIRLTLVYTQAHCRSFGKWADFTT